jgi:hypothetical protein
MNIYLWLAVSLSAWCAVAGVAGLLLGHLIAFGTEPLVLAPRAAADHLAAPVVPTCSLMSEPRRGRARSRLSIETAARKPSHFSS